MIAKVGKSTSISGTINYLTNDESRVDWKEAVYLADDDKNFVIDQMKKASEHSRTERLMYHYSISWDSHDDPSKEQMMHVAKKTLSDLGMDQHQALIVAHNDHDFKHLHVAVNRVSPETGKAWETWNDYRKLETSLRKLEREFGWREVPGHFHRLEGQKKPHYGLSLNQKESEQLKNNQLPFSKIVYKSAQKDFLQSKTWEELHIRLNQRGLTILKGKRGTGGKITDGIEIANLSKVHRAFSMNKLTDRLGPYRSLPQTLNNRYGKHYPEVSKYSTYEISCRFRSPSTDKYLKSLERGIKGYKSAKQLKNILTICAGVSSPQSLALSSMKKLINGAVKQLQHQKYKQTERG